MNARVLGIELRRSAARWAALIAVLSPLLLRSYNEQVGLGLSAIASGQRALLQLSIPLALAVGAWQARRERRSRMGELLATTSRPPWQRLLMTAAALGTGAMAGSLAVTGVLAAYAALLGAYFSPGAMVYIAVTAVYVAVSVWFGLAIGRLLPSVLTPPLLALGAFVGYGAWVIATDDGPGIPPRPGSHLLFPPLAGPFGNFETFTVGVQLAQVTWVLALAAAALILYSAGRYARLAAVVPVVLGLAVAQPLLPRYQAEAAVPDRGANAPFCTPDAPKVCVRRGHHLALDGLREPGRRALVILAEKLPQAPTAVGEYFEFHGRPGLPLSQVDTVYVVVMDDAGGRIAVPEREVLWSLLMGAGTLGCGAPGSDQAGYLTARLIAAAWLIGETPLSKPEDDVWWGWLPPLSVTMPAYQTFLGLPAGEQRTRAAALRRAELACDGSDRLEILIGAR